MKGFGYDGAAHSSPHQSLTPKLVVCLSQGGLQPVCSQSIQARASSVYISVCESVFAMCLHATPQSGRACVWKVALWSACRSAALYIGYM